MKKLFILPILFACSNKEAHIVFDRYCGPEQSQIVAKFIVDCATAANPKSDEEGEDLVAQCERTAENVLCPEVAHVYGGIAEVYRKPCFLSKEPYLVKACEPYRQ